jgi:hypothetical protein
LKKAVENPSAWRDRLHSINDRYLDVQQDILETFVDRGQLRKLAEPTLLPNGKPIPGLKRDHPRQLALMHALVRFCAHRCRKPLHHRRLYPLVVEILDVSPADYKLGSLRYDLAKLRVKALVEKVSRARRYRLTPQGCALCLVFLTLFERIYAPSPPACANPSHATPGSRSRNAPGGTASISASPTISISCSKPLDLESPKRLKERHTLNTGQGASRTIAYKFDQIRLRPPCA